MAAQEDAREGGDLIVPGPPGAQLAAKLGADVGDQQPLEGCVHVLVGLRGPHAPGRDLRAQLHQRGVHLLGLGARQVPGLVERLGVRDRTHEVIICETPVEVRGL